MARRQTPRRSHRLGHRWWSESYLVRRTFDSMITESGNTDGDESSLLLRVQQYPWDVDVFPITGATSMCSLPVFVGLDYHDASVRVCVLDTARIDEWEIHGRTNDSFLLDKGRAF